MISIYEEYWRQRSDLVKVSERPVAISFSQEGYQRAMAETDGSSLQLWSMKPDDVHWTHYGGLPFTVDREQIAMIIVKGKSDYDQV